MLHPSREPAIYAESGLDPLLKEEVEYGSETVRRGTLGRNWLLYVEGWRGFVVKPRIVCGELPRLTGRWEWKMGRMVGPEARA